jgi:hypothetical protein
MYARHPATPANLEHACHMANTREWQHAAYNGSVIAAIKLVRASTKLSLKEAKDVVEQWVDDGCTFSTFDVIKLPSKPGGGEARRVIEHGDQSFTLEVVRTERYYSMAELLAAITRLDNPGYTL